jgi:hypothetical protein
MAKLLRVDEYQYGVNIKSRCYTGNINTDSRMLT